ncbi:MAG TPA: disulfide bond formation protein B [Devosia sp.]|nr:disulfide bond formation protein B [Devosia sp.]
MTAATDTAPRALPTDKLAVGIAFVLGLATIAGAWGSQIFGGLVPCELCLEQRMAYYWGLPVLALVLILWNRLPLAVWYIGVALGAAIFIWSTYMASYHAGVEWGFWPGPTACTGTGTGIDLDALASGNLGRVISCDAVQFRDPVLRLSLAGWNALISLGIVILLAAAVVFQYRRKAA